MVICGDIIAKLWIRYVGWNFFKPGVLIFYARGDARISSKFFVSIVVSNNVLKDNSNVFTFLSLKQVKKKLAICLADLLRDILRFACFID